MGVYSEYRIYGTRIPWVKFERTSHIAVVSHAKVRFFVLKQVGGRWSG